MKLSPKNKELLINIWLLVVLPLIVYWLVLRNNKVTQRYLASLELTEEWKKEVERLNAEYEKEHPELDFLYYDNWNYDRN
jgi:hypothetical protein